MRSGDGCAWQERGISVRFWVRELGLVWIHCFHRSDQPEDCQNTSFAIKTSAMLFIPSFFQ